MKKNSITQRSAQPRLTDYRIDATGRDVCFEFETDVGRTVFVMSHSDACKFAGRLLNKADFFACRRASTRHDRDSLGSIAEGLSVAVAKGELTRGQAEKLLNRAKRRSADPT